MRGWGIGTCESFCVSVRGVMHLHCVQSLTGSVHRNHSAHRTLIYSYFNGSFRKNGTYARRPIYRELRKSEDEPFESITGAEFRYCPEERVWAFIHEDIRKTQDAEDVSKVRNRSILVHVEVPIFVY